MDPTVEPLLNLHHHHLPFLWRRFSGQTAAPIPAPAPGPAKAAQRPASRQQAQGYTVYETNGLKVSLRRRVSVTRPGVVLVTARFEATGAAAVTGINFQAGVPKARLAFYLRNEGG